MTSSSQALTELTRPEFGTRECTLNDGVSADVDLTQPLMIAVHNHGTSP